MEYDGFLASGALVVAPLLKFDSRRVSLAGQASWTLFESGNDVLQGTVAAAWRVASQPHRHLEVFGSAGASRYATGDPAGHLFAGTRLHLFRNTTGGWIGASAGRSSGFTGLPVELSMAGWSVRNRLTMIGTITAAFHEAGRQLDLVGTVRWSGPLGELEAQVGARPWGGAPRQAGESGSFTGVYGEVTASIPLTRQLSLALSGGKHPSDPVRGLLGASFVSAEARVYAFGPRNRSLPLEVAGVLRGWTVPTNERGPRLELEGTGGGERRTLRVVAPGARAVEVMGDFTDWLPVMLRQVAPSVWAIELPLAPGVHRMNLRIDGGPWIVPAGVRVETTEFGGPVGILVVP